jgi:hypothetical protein
MRATLDRNPNTPAASGRARAGWTLGGVVSVVTGGYALGSVG